jgi:hypothetical protein
VTVEHLLVLLVGIVVLLGTARSVLIVLIVPRPASTLIVYPMIVVRATYRRMSQLARTYDAKDRILAVAEPTALIVLLITWLVMTMAGFTLVNWGVGHDSFATAFSEAGSSVFTLGFAVSHTSGPRVVDFIAAGTGLVLVALQIAYLPTLYSSYNRRETLVTLLESRAGSPAWGPELLIRHQLVGSIDNLTGLFADWERWAADVTESHCTYPSLLYLRSPRSRNSWIVSLLAVMDAAALALAVDPVGAPTEARMCLRMGFTCLRDIAQVTRIPFDADPSPDGPVELLESSFDAALRQLESTGYPMSRPVDEAWAHFRGWRVNYESLAYALTYRLDAPPAPWSGPRRRFRGESMEPARPVDRQPSGVPTGLGRIERHPTATPDGPQR